MNDLASNYMKLNQADKALEIFEKLENSQSDEYRAMSKRFQGAYYLSRKEYSKAETFFNETLQIYQTDTTSLQGLANIYMYRKQWNKALKYTEKYLSYSPNNTQILFYAAYLNYNMQNYNETEKYLLKRIELDPEDANTLALYANVKTKTKKYDEAIELFEKAYSINKNDDYQQSINFLKRVKQQNK
jgi:tetratricopeptide (TPR) repeat protein